MSTNRALAELVRRAGIPISRTPKRLRDTPVTLAKERLVEIEALLHLRDGFRTLSGALIVRPSVTVALMRGVEEWNQLTLWRTPYRHASEVLFFAEDILGRQFGLHKDEIVTFDPETGAVEHHAFKLETWAEKMLEDPDDLGESRVLAWQEDHGPLAPTDRLQPSVPFVLAQAQDVEFRVIGDLELMRRYARLYKQTRELPEGASVDLDGWWAEL